MIRMFGLLTTAALIGVSAFAADYAKAGALANKGTWDISITFDPSVNRATAFLEGNYLLPAGATLEDLRDQPLDNAVILSVSGLATNVAYTVTLTNVQSTAGATLPALPLTFTTKPMSWAAIGVQELGFPAQTVAVGHDGFDLISGGIEMYGTYDESTFAYEPVTGDFDKRVRVVLQEGSSPEARAGLMIRETLDELKPRPIDPTNPDESFARYLQIQANPVTTAFTDFDGISVPGRNQYQINLRALAGGATENPPTDTNAPAYPNAWMRLKRVGQTFFVFRGTDGTNWTRLGSFTFPTTDLDGNPVPPFPKDAFLGPNYSAETGNIPESSGMRRAFLAQFRDYSNASGEVELEEPTLSIALNGPQVEVTWSAGVLQTTTNIASNVWVDLGSVSPFKFTPDKRYQFFRARNP